MKITKVRLNPPTSSGKVKAYADITIDDCFVVNGLRVIDGRNGLFVAMPSRKRDDGTYADIAHPITADFRRELMDAVLEAYNHMEETAPDAPF